MIWFLLVSLFVATNASAIDRVIGFESPIYDDGTTYQNFRNGLTGTFAWERHRYDGSEQFQNSYPNNLGFVYQKTLGSEGYLTFDLDGADWSGQASFHIAPAKFCQPRTVCTTTHILCRTDADCAGADTCTDKTIWWCDSNSGANAGLPCNSDSDCNSGLCVNSGFDYGTVEGKTCTSDAECGDIPGECAFAPTHVCSFVSPGNPNSGIPCAGVNNNFGPNDLSCPGFGGCLLMGAQGGATACSSQWVDNTTDPVNFPASPPFHNGLLCEGEVGCNTATGETTNYCRTRKLKIAEFQGVAGEHLCEFYVTFDEGFNRFTLSSEFGQPHAVCDGGLRPGTICGAGTIFPQADNCPAELVGDVVGATFCREMSVASLLGDLTKQHEVSVWMRRLDPVAKPGQVTCGISLDGQVADNSSKVGECTTTAGNDAEEHWACGTDAECGSAPPPGGGTGPYTCTQPVNFPLVKPSKLLLGNIDGVDPLQWSVMQLDHLVIADDVKIDATGCATSSGICRARVRVASMIPDQDVSRSGWTAHNASFQGNPSFTDALSAAQNDTQQLSNPGSNAPPFDRWMDSPAQGSTVVEGLSDISLVMNVEQDPTDSSPIDEYLLPDTGVSVYGILRRTGTNTNPRFFSMFLEDAVPNQLFGHNEDIQSDPNAKYPLLDHYYTAYIDLFRTAADGLAWNNASRDPLATINAQNLGGTCPNGNSCLSWKAGWSASWAEVEIMRPTKKIVSPLLDINLDGVVSFQWHGDSLVNTQQLSDALAINTPPSWDITNCSLGGQTIEHIKAVLDAGALDDGSAAGKCRVIKGNTTAPDYVLLEGGANNIVFGGVETWGSGVCSPASPNRYAHCNGLPQTLADVKSGTTVAEQKLQYPIACIFDAGNPTAWRCTTDSSTCDPTSASACGSQQSACVYTPSACGGIGVPPRGKNFNSQDWIDAKDSTKNKWKFCSVTTSQSCFDDTDCPGGETCSINKCYINTQTTCSADSDCTQQDDFCAGLVDTPAWQVLNAAPGTWNDTECGTGGFCVQHVPINVISRNFITKLMDAVVAKNTPTEKVRPIVLCEYKRRVVPPEQIPFNSVGNAIGLGFKAGLERKCQQTLFEAKKRGWAWFDMQSYLDRVCPGGIEGCIGPDGVHFTIEGDTLLGEGIAQMLRAQPAQTPWYDANPLCGGTCP